MFMVLSRLGLGEITYKMVSQTSYPSYGYMLESGATTLWESWDFSDNIASHNHPMYGAVGEWFYKCLAGIDFADDAIAFDHIMIRPDFISDLSWVSAQYDSVRGTIASSWTWDSKQFCLNVTIPINTQATVIVPSPSYYKSFFFKSVDIKGHIGKEDLEALQRSSSTYSVGSGEYTFCNS
eukprot:TRINITY_DN1268_c0_g1_i2.p1 TRINITY_DN1268_c0_g1~~TRINITY_DN1268_c0_g1_i2.p1  ORF type:complete len:180 (-),score=27.03 TRINITY_DN1268_c0_g1_i2:53-592(-)